MNSFAVNILERVIGGVRVHTSVGYISGSWEPNQGMPVFTFRMGCQFSGGSGLWEQLC